MEEQQYCVESKQRTVTSATLDIFLKKNKTT